MMTVESCIISRILFSDIIRRMYEYIPKKSGVEDSNIILFNVLTYKKYEVNIDKSTVKPSDVLDCIMKENDFKRNDNVKVWEVEGKRKVVNERRRNIVFILKLT